MEEIVQSEFQDDGGEGTGDEEERVVDIYLYTVLFRDLW